MFIEATKGNSIYLHIQHCIAEARKHFKEVETEFNETKLLISPFSHEDDIYTIWTLKRKLHQLKGD